MIRVGNEQEIANKDLDFSGSPDRFQQLFSLFQIRLVGAILIGYVLLRVALVVSLSQALDPFTRLSQLSTLANTAIVLPLGCALYLLGSGFRRLALEKPLLRLLFPLLLPLALLSGVLLPATIAVHVHKLQTLQSQANQASQAMLEENRNWDRRMSKISNVTDAEDFFNLIGLSVPVSANDPIPLVRWRFSQALQKRHSDLLDQKPLARITPYQQELLSVSHLIDTTSLAAFSGLSLLMLFVQGRRRFQKYHLSSSNFLTSEAIKPRNRKS